MSLVADLARDLDDASLSSDQQAMMRCHTAYELEMAGDYEAARIALGDLWQGVGERPLLTALGPEVSAEVLLRVGSLSGSIGSSRQIDNAHQAAKDLVLESATAFADLGNAEKVAEANIALAVCYWREGLLDKARAALQDVITRLGDHQSELKMRAIMNMAIIEGAKGRLTDALHMLTDAAPLFDESRGHTQGDMFHAALATLLNNLGEQSDDVSSAGLAALTFLEELGDEISIESKFALYEFADRTLGEAAPREIVERLRTCARQSLTIGQSSTEGTSWQKSSQPGMVEPWPGCSLEEEVRKYEGELIKRALETARGSVTRAARLLGITHQGLAFILQGRHKSLLSSRTPARARRRSVMRPGHRKSKAKKQ